MDRKEGTEPGFTECRLGVDDSVWFFIYQLLFHTQTTGKVDFVSPILQIGKLRVKAQVTWSKTQLVNHGARIGQKSYIHSVYTALSPYF